MAGYLKIGDIKGQAEDKAHQEWIELIRVGEVVTRPMVAGGGGQAGRQQSAVTFQDLEVTKRLDKSTPKLAEAICDGKVFNEVEIHLCTAEGAGGRKPYFQIKLKNVKVTRHALDASADPQSCDMETMTLNFTEIEWTYTSINPDGSSAGDTKATWKVGPGVR